MEQLRHSMEFLSLAQLDHGFIVLLRVLLIVVAAWILLVVIRRVLRLSRERLTRSMDDPEQLKRAATLGNDAGIIGVADLVRRP